jgi:hypothetical protein
LSIFVVSFKPQDDFLRLGSICFRKPSKAKDGACKRILGHPGQKGKIRLFVNGSRRLFMEVKICNIRKTPPDLRAKYFFDLQMEGIGILKRCKFYVSKNGSSFFTTPSFKNHQDEWEDYFYPDGFDLKTLSEQVRKAVERFETERDKPFDENSIPF